MKAPTQPLISADRVPLMSAVLHDNLHLDFYGSHDGERYEVDAVALAGDRRDLECLFTYAEMRDFAAHCDRHLPSGAELEAERREAARESFGGIFRCDLQRLEALGVGA